MGKVYPELDERLRNFISRQPVFFVATAPSVTGHGDGGHVNISPKGLKDTFAVLGPRTVAYLDLTGSGAETVAHLRNNGRITIMFCSFASQAKVLRIYGRGRTVPPGDAEWPGIASRFGAIADCCGYGVPVMELSGERDLLDDWSGRRSDAAQSRRSLATSRSGTISTLNGRTARNVSAPVACATST